MEAGPAASDEAPTVRATVPSGRPSTIFALHRYSNAYPGDSVTFYSAQTAADAWKHAMQHNWKDDAYQLLDVSDTFMSAEEEGLLFTAPHAVRDVLAKYGRKEEGSTRVMVPYAALQNQLDTLHWDLVEHGCTDDPFPSWNLRMIAMQPGSKYLIWRNTSTTRGYYCSPVRVWTDWGDKKGDGDLCETPFRVRDVIMVS